MVDEFDSYVRPVYNPRLTPFSIRLTAISQAPLHPLCPLPHHHPCCPEQPFAPFLDTHPARCPGYTPRCTRDTHPFSAAIAQADVDAAPPLDEVLARYTARQPVSSAACPVCLPSPDGAGRAYAPRSEA